jgi:hypothetical protein
LLADHVESVRTDLQLYSYGLNLILSSINLERLWLDACPNVRPAAGDVNLGRGSRRCLRGWRRANFQKDGFPMKMSRRTVRPMPVFRIFNRSSEPEALGRAGLSIIRNVRASKPIQY